MRRSAPFIIVDAFVFMHHGVSPADHVVSGIVPVVILLVMTWAFQRLLAGAAAAMSGTLGFAVAIGGASTSGSALIDGRWSLGALLGGAAAASGVVLIALSGTILFRARRRGGSWHWRWLRRAAWTAMAVVLVSMVSIPVGIGYMLWAPDGNGEKCWTSRRSSRRRVTDLVPSTP